MPRTREFTVLDEEEYDDIEFRFSGIRNKRGSVYLGPIKVFPSFPDSFWSAASLCPLVQRKYHAHPGKIIDVVYKADGKIAKIPYSISEAEESGLYVTFTCERLNDNDEYPERVRVSHKAESYQ